MKIILLSLAVATVIFAQAQRLADVEYWHKQTFQRVLLGVRRYPARVRGCSLTLNRRFWLIVIGVALYLVNTYITMDPAIKGILSAVVVILVIFWIINMFVPLGSLSHLRWRLR